MTSPDLTDPYFHVPILLYLHFAVGGHMYQFCHLPLRPYLPTYIFSECEEMVLALLREKGMKILIYIDNYLICTATWQSWCYACCTWEISNADLRIFGCTLAETNSMGSTSTGAERLGGLGLTQPPPQEVSAGVCSSLCPGLQTRTWKPLKHPWWWKPLFASQLNRKHILVRSDNSIVLAYTSTIKGALDPQPCTGCWWQFWPEMITMCSL